MGFSLARTRCTGKHRVSAWTTQIKEVLSSDMWPLQSFFTLKHVPQTLSESQTASTSHLSQRSFCGDNDRVIIQHALHGVQLTLWSVWVLRLESPRLIDTSFFRSCRFNLICYRSVLHRVGFFSFVMWSWMSRFVFRLRVWNQLQFTTSWFNENLKW